MNYEDDDNGPYISKACLRAAGACFIIVACLIGIGLATAYGAEIDGVIEWVW